METVEKRWTGERDFHLAALNALIGRRLSERTEEETVAALCSLKLGSIALEKKKEAFA